MVLPTSNLSPFEGVSSKIEIDFARNSLYRYYPIPMPNFLDVHYFRSSTAIRV